MSSNGGGVLVRRWLILGSTLGLFLLGFALPESSFSFQEDEQKAESTLDRALLKKVRILQRQLNSDDAKERKAAEAELISLGTKVLDYLPDPDPNFGADFNSSLKSIRKKIETVAEKEFSNPRRISFNGTHKVKDILAAFEVQTGNKITAGEEVKDLEITVSFEDELFWEAADKLSELTKCELYFGMGGEAILSTGAPEGRVFDNVEYAEGFRFQATGIQTRRNLIQKGSLPSGNVSVSLKWEPRYRIIRLELPYSELQAKDSLGNENKTVVFPKEGSLEFGASPEELGIDLPISFALKEGKHEKEFSISGTLNAIVSGRLESFMFDKLDKVEKPRTIKRSGVQASLVKVVEEDHLLAVAVDVSFADAKSTIESHMGWMYENPAFLVDKDGKQHAYVGKESGGESENSIRVIYLFEKPESLEGWKLKYQCPGILIEKEVPFQLNKVRLPF